jgi:hypothetical protein
MHNDWLEKTQRSEDSEQLPATADTRMLGG